MAEMGKDALWRKMSTLDLVKELHSRGDSAYKYAPGDPLFDVLDGEIHEELLRRFGGGGSPLAEGDRVMVEASVRSVFPNCVAASVEVRGFQRSPEDGSPSTTAISFDMPTGAMARLGSIEFHPERMSPPMDGSTYVNVGIPVSVREKDGHWACEGVGLDYYAVGDTRQDAVDHFEAGVRLTCVENARAGQSAFAVPSGTVGMEAAMRVEAAGRWSVTTVLNDANGQPTNESFTRYFPREDDARAFYEGALPDDEV